MTKNSRKIVQFTEGLENPDLFTRGEWEVVQYIKEHKREVSEMNIGQLADQAYSSNGSIIRICRKLGCDGFKELKQRLIQNLENDKYMDKEVNFSMPFQVGESVSDILTNMSSLYRNGINAIQEYLNPETLQTCADLILQSDRFFIYGIGDSQITAEGFVNKLIKLGKFGIVATAHNEQEGLFQYMNEKDCVLFISYSGTNSLMVKTIPEMRKRNVSIIGITSVPDSPIGKLSTYPMYIPHLEGDTDEKIATFYSQLAFGYILDILYALCYNKLNKK